MEKRDEVKRICLIFRDIYNCTHFQFHSTDAKNLYFNEMIDRDEKFSKADVLVGKGGESAPIHGPDFAYGNVTGDSG